MAILAKLGLGMLLYWLLGAAAYLVRSRMLDRKFPLLGAAIAVAGLAFQAGVRTNLETASPPIDGLAAVGESLVALGIAIALPCLATVMLAPDSVWSRSGKALAAFSFTLYLVHYPIVMGMAVGLGKSSHLSFAALATFVLMIAVSIATAFVFWLLFERNTSAARQFLFSIFGLNRTRVPLPAAE